MSIIRFVTSDGLPAFLAFLSQNGRRVLVPVEKPANKRSVVFEPWREGMSFTLEKATVPPKAAVLPQCETLVSYKKSKDPENPERVSMSLDDSIEARAHRDLRLSALRRARFFRAGPTLSGRPLCRSLLQGAAGSAYGDHPHLRLGLQHLFLSLGGRRSLFPRGLGRADDRNRRRLSAPGRHAQG